MRKILVADDDLSMLEVVSSALEEPGVEVSRATSGADFILRLADDGPFDLVVTDISMPWMSGLQVAQSARTAGLNVPTVFMTALRDRRIDDQVAALGKSATLLRKPFGLDELKASVDSLLH